MTRKYLLEIQKQERVTCLTMALIPQYTNTGHLHCTVVGMFGENTVEENPLNVLNESCEYYGSSFDGRLKAAQQILEGKKNLPIMVSITLEYCMIPLASPMKKDTAWVSYRHIERIIPKGPNSIIIFSNHIKLEVNITKDVLEDRMNKAARLISTYHFRQKRMKDNRDGDMIAEDPEDY